MLNNVTKLGAYALERLRALEQKYAAVRDVRGLGLLLGVELQTMASGVTAAQAAERVMYGALRRGLNFKVTMGTILTLTPALTITPEEIDTAVSILDAELALLEQ